MEPPDQTPDTRRQTPDTEKPESVRKPDTKPLSHQAITIPNNAYELANTWAIAHTARAQNESQTQQTKRQPIRKPTFVLLDNKRFFTHKRGSRKSYEMMDY